MNNRTAKTVFITPTEHGQIFFHPSLPRITEDIQNNRRLFDTADINFLDQSLPQRRLATRTELLTLAQDYCRSLSLATPTVRPEQPLIVTGHQCEFIHCGVLIKYMLLNHLAAATNGVALNLVVDSDLPKHTSLAIPCLGEQLQRCELSLSSVSPQVPMQYQPAPTADDISRFAAELNALALPDHLRPRAQHIIELLQQAAQQASDLAEMFMLLNRRLAEQLHLTWIDLPVSLMARSQSFATFAQSLLNDSRRVRQCYNQALADYRRANKIRNPAQPLPPLAELDETIRESPFWVLQPNCPRQPAYANDHGDIFAGPSPTSASTGMELRPRALTLTIFARLFLADTFLHGTGGARYDHIADRFIKNYYGIEPPAFAATSATMRLPLGDYLTGAQAREQLRHLAWRLRDLRYNPQRYIDNAALVAARCDAIAQSDRLRRDHADKHKRKVAFETIRQLNRKFHQTAPQLQDDLQHRQQAVLQNLQAGRIAHDREYYFALHDPDELKKLMNRIQT